MKYGIQGFLCPFGHRTAYKPCPCGSSRYSASTLVAAYCNTNNQTFIATRNYSKINYRVNSACIITVCFALSLMGYSLASSPIRTFFLVFCLPEANPVTSQTLNYTPVAVGIVAVGTLGSWIVWAHRWFQGPKRQLEVELGQTGIVAEEKTVAGPEAQKESKIE
ncbi:hypothetical protein V1523DRAFT_161129 [Lipomyces doorenjongii]